MRCTSRSPWKATLVLALSPTVGLAAPTAALEARVELVGAPFAQGQIARGAVKVTVTSGTSSGKIGVDKVAVTVKVTSGDGWLVADDGALPKSLTQETDEKGVARFDLKLGASEKAPTLRVGAERKVSAADGTETREEVAVAPNELPVRVSGYAGEFLSPTLATEVLLGVVFQDKYDANGNTEGFKDRRFIAQVSFDTLWPKAHPTACFSSKHPSDGKAPKECAWHTGLSLRFSSLPVVSNDTGEGTSGSSPSVPSSFTDVADALTGTLYGVYVPRSLTRYREIPSKGEPLYDAFQLGVVGKGGFITRERVSNDSGDTLILLFGGGLRFTHHQTAAKDFPEDTRNVIPLRFVEITGIHYDEYAGRRNPWRLVVEAAFRLPVIGDALPFYGGISANIGAGPDDVRLFAALIFKLDRVVTLLGM